MTDGECMFRRVIFGSRLDRIPSSRNLDGWEGKMTSKLGENLTSKLSKSENISKVARKSRRSHIGDVRPCACPKRVGSPDGQENGD